MHVQQLSKQIQQKDVLNDVSFTLYDQQITGLIGRNGSGKTTLFRTLSGQYLPDSGKITINDKDLASFPEEKTQIFYFDEKNNFFGPYSLKKIGQFYREMYPAFDQDLFLYLIEKNNLPLHTSFKQLSKGMQGLFAMILALTSNAKYILLDEPFDGLDVIVRKNVIGLLLENLSETDRSVLIASHNLAELEGLVDRVLLLKNQTIAHEYTLEDVRAQAKKIQLVFTTKKVPLIVKEKATAIDMQGRVITALFEQFDDSIEQAILASEPIVYEELPLSLEDLFEANFQK